MNARLIAPFVTVICVFSLAARAGQVIETVEVVEGPTPFIGFVHAHVSDLDHFEFVQFLIRPKTKSATRPVKVRYARSYLEARGYLDLQHSAVTVPVFGLYAGRTNRVTITFGFSIGFRKNTQLDIDIVTPNYDGGTYSNPTVIQSPGETRTYSARRKYQIDLDAFEATETWHYYPDPSVYSPFCSSVYEDAPDNYLIDYTLAAHLSIPAS